MKKRKLSPWHDGYVKPVLIGVYERDFGEYALYSKWNGAYWLDGDYSIEAANKSFSKSAFQYEQWRGILKD